MPAVTLDDLRARTAELARRLRPVRRHLIALAVVLVLALILVGLRLVGIGIGGIPVLAGESCSVKLAGKTYKLTSDQGERAGAIAVEGVRRGLPARAVSVVLAVELADHDLEAGQRAGSLYGKVTGIAGYRALPLPTVAARVGAGDRGDYKRVEGEARALSSALTGNSPEAFSCIVKGTPGSASDKLDAVGLVARAQKVLDDVESSFGHVPPGGYAPGGVHSGHMPGSAHYEGRAVDFFFRPITPAERLRGWALAQYLVSQAKRLDIRTIIFDDRIWTALRSGAGWRDYQVPPGTSGDRAILEHRDHVHADVAD